MVSRSPIASPVFALVDLRPTVAVAIQAVESAGGEFVFENGAEAGLRLWKASLGDGSEAESRNDIQCQHGSEI